MYHVADEELAHSTTFPQSAMSCNGKNIGYDPFTVAIMNPDGEFDPNDITLYYYAEPDVKK